MRKVLFMASAFVLLLCLALGGFFFWKRYCPFGAFPVVEFVAELPDAPKGATKSRYYSSGIYDMIFDVGPWLRYWLPVVASGIIAGFALLIMLFTRRRKVVTAV